MIFSRACATYTCRMIESGEIHAAIDTRDGMVRFLEDPEQYNNISMANRIDQQIRKCMHLAEKLQSLNDMVSYQSKLSWCEHAQVSL